MDVQVQKMLVLGLIGCVVGFLGYLTEREGRDGSGWGLVAICFFLTSCNAGG